MEGIAAQRGIDEATEQGEAKIQPDEDGEISRWSTNASTESHSVAFGLGV